MRIGDLFSKLEEIYPALVTKTDPDDSYASVKVDDFFFSSITFFYDEDAKPKRVTHIFFRLNTAFTISNPAGEMDLKKLLSNLQNQDSQLRTLALKEQLVKLYGPGKLAKRETVWINTDVGGAQFFGWQTLTFPAASIAAQGSVSFLRDLPHD